jgi:membrane protein GlpM
MKLLIRALLGAGVVVLISALSGTKSYYVAGLVPLFPTFTLISHYVVGTERTVAELKATIRFGIWSLIPYAAYMVVLYLLVDRMRLQWALLSAVGAWLIAAAILILLWNRG